MDYMLFANVMEAILQKNSIKFSLHNDPYLVSYRVMTQSIPHSYFIANNT